MKTTALFFNCIFLAILANGQIIHVPDDYPTIQQGINAAIDGDTVLVYPGTYSEHVNYNQKNITVASLFLINPNPALISQTIIDGSNSGRGVTMWSNSIGSGFSTMICGFTIRNGKAGGGGGISAGGENQIIKGVIVKNNKATFEGGGIDIGSGNVVIENAIIRQNIADADTNEFADGGGIYIYSANVTIINTLIVDNDVSAWWASSGGGIFNLSGNLLLKNVTISSNDSGGGLCNAEGFVTIFNSIIWDNVGGSVNLPALITYSDIQGGWSGQGNINQTPVFSGGGNYSLSDCSPCIETGTLDTTGLNLPPYDLIMNLRVWDGDGDGIARVDMGAYEFESIPVGETESNAQSSGLQVLFYPNPFSNSITIEYIIKVNTTVTLTLFNHLGHEVVVLINDQLCKGLYHLKWNAQDQPEGLYYCQLRTGDQIETKKIIKL